MMSATMKRKVTYREECDLKVIFIENWALIVEAYTRGLPNGPFTPDQVASIETIRKAEMLDGLKLNTMWRKVVDEVSGERSIFGLVDNDKRLIVEAWVRLAGLC